MTRIVQMHDNRLTIEWTDRSTSDFHYVWRRDN
ncbi:MAG: DUF971 domain-containing protein [Acidimicrobiia bacterium]|nr:DUF971 domain-containing protein [Acidimicrobiia bacterium]